jgi:pantoate--beta-alanine ligase
MSKTLISIADLKRDIESMRTANERVAFVPTMGALHEGHLSLVKEARNHADRVVVSIFVNPLQFGPQEDFAKYPRTLKEDIALLDGVDVIWAPNAAELYPDHFQTNVTNRKMSSHLCGAARPGHFDGVLTVVMKFFNIVQPDIAVFGKKDFQQFKLIEQMVKDLSLKINVIGAPIVREQDGLAMSSRNRYLSVDDRADATRIYQGLQKAKELYKKGSRNKQELVDTCREVIVSSKKFAVEYIEICDVNTLSIVEEKSTEKSTTQIPDEPVVMLVAARLGQTRLIDNMEF